jgi:hypothetical protein
MSISLERQKELRHLILADLEAVNNINGKDAARDIAVAQLYYSTEWLVKSYPREKVVDMLESQLRNVRAGKW